MIFRLLSPKGPLRVQPFYGYRTATHLHLTARALRSKPSGFDRKTFLGGLRTMLREYLSHEVGGVEVSLTFETGDGRVVRERATTNSEGFASFAVPFGHAYDLPHSTGWEKALLRWPGLPGGENPGEATAHILAPGKSAGLGIISDIDDTILETGITGNFRAIARNWKRVMAQMPGQRAIVPGAPDFYGALGGRAAAVADPGDTSIPQARPRPVFYVSSSPWNLFNYLVAFKQVRGMPQGPIMLRDWGFNRRTFGSAGHGSHKVDAIRQIIEGYPELKFALVGDDTQKDLVAFGQIVEQHRERIGAVFIRRVSSEPLSAEELDAQARISAQDVPFWLGDDYAQARAFLADAGLEMSEAVEELVKTASEGPKAADAAKSAAPEKTGAAEPR